jgi:hypothetical protein
MGFLVVRRDITSASESGASLDLDTMRSYHIARGNSGVIQMLDRDPRILFIATGDYADYQCDCVFHGLKMLLGDNVVDIRPPWYMYESTDENKDKFSTFYGKGFTLYGHLKFSDKIDRSDILSKIKNKYFDKIIYGSIFRSQEYIYDVLNYYDAKDISFIDGEDQTDLLRFLLGRGVYFKRELLEYNYSNSSESRVLPIEFGIPRKHIVPEVPNKSRVIAHIDPRDRSTYIYDNQEDYYKGYQDSCFGITTKKAGWDCLRHYEILANGCFPLFLDLLSFPSSIMVRFPKMQMLWALKRMLESNHLRDFKLDDEYIFHLSKAMDILRRDGTTEAIAKRILMSSK